MSYSCIQQGQTVKPTKSDTTVDSWLTQGTRLI